MSESGLTIHLILRRSGHAVHEFVSEARGFEWR
jgi:hypothetical protein